MLSAKCLGKMPAQMGPGRRTTSRQGSSPETHKALEPARPHQGGQRGLMCKASGASATQSHDAMPVPSLAQSVARATGGPRWTKPHCARMGGQHPNSDSGDEGA